jgi:hypothetical protein
MLLQLFGSIIIYYYILQINYYLHIDSVHVKFGGFNLKVCMFTISVIVHLQTIFCVQSVGMFVIFYSAKFHIPSSNGSLVISVILQAKENIHMAAMLFHTEQKIILNISYIL